jgi:hypothetical protein
MIEIALRRRLSEVVAGLRVATGEQGRKTDVSVRSLHISQVLT